MPVRRTKKLRGSTAGFSPPFPQSDSALIGPTAPFAESRVGRNPPSGFLGPSALLPRTGPLFPALTADSAEFFSASDSLDRPYSAAPQPSAEADAAANAGPPLPPGVIAAVIGGTAALAIVCLAVARWHRRAIWSAEYEVAEEPIETSASTAFATVIGNHDFVNPLDGTQSVLSDGLWLEDDGAEAMTARK
jgi:hypothetical protein